KACTRKTATPNPLINPKIAPIAKVTNKGTIIGSCGKSAYILDGKLGSCNKEAPTTAENPRTLPADKSVPCNTINPAAPNAIMARVEASPKIYVRISTDRKDGSIIIIMRITISNTTYKQYCSKKSH